jgi:hypothetical protein
MSISPYHDHNLPEQFYRFRDLQKGVLNTTAMNGGNYEIQKIAHGIERGKTVHFYLLSNFGGADIANLGDNLNIPLFNFQHGILNTLLQRERTLFCTH